MHFITCPLCITSLLTIQSFTSNFSSFSVHVRPIITQQIKQLIQGYNCCFICTLNIELWLLATVKNNVFMTSYVVWLLRLFNDLLPNKLHKFCHLLRQADWHLYFTKTSSEQRKWIYWVHEKLPIEHFTKSWLTLHFSSKQSCLHPLHPTLNNCKVQVVSQS